MLQSNQQLLTVIVPAYNEEDVISEFHVRLTSVLDAVPMDVEILYVNDGSRDRTMKLLNTIHSEDDSVAVLDLSRNFGKEVAMSAGLHHAQGDAVVIIDADLQDPPELIPQFITEWKNGYDVVYAKRTRRKGETFIKKGTAHLFYRIMQKLSNFSIPEDTGDYRLMNRRAVDALCKLTERHRFMKGLFAWIGYKQKAVLYDRDERYAGETKWNYLKLWNFAIEGITSFTIVPLKFASYFGGTIAFLSFLYGTYMIVSTLLYGNQVPGYPSLMVIVLFLGGIQLSAIGLLGEYVGRIFTETKQRPLYFVQEHLHRRRGS
ncbi:MAG: glycosyltransferase family 2 protein [Pseudomonadota bacterium]